MSFRNFTITKLEGYSGIRLKDEKPLTLKAGINLLVGRNGSGKSNLINLVHQIASDRGDMKSRIESSFFVKHLKRCLQETTGNIESRFGEVTIAEYEVNGIYGSIRMYLRNTPELFVVNNLLRPGEKFDGHIELTIHSIQLSNRSIQGNQSTLKFEMNGYINTNVLSKEHDNKVHKIMEGPIKDVSDFVRGRIIEFYKSEEFVSRMIQLENSINAKFSKFFGATRKKVRINFEDISFTGRISLSLMDGENYIESSALSLGETTLLNLVFSLALATEEESEILSLDEPDIHMHDDMIQVLVDELSELSNRLPKTIIIIASHSTAMIERLAALGQKNLNVVTFDQERNVCNDASDIELINALSRNGVKFSPLMLSKRSNIFIENQLIAGREHRDFLLRFFSGENQPNIIPIGSSGNVQDTNSFNGIFEEILNVSNIRSIGIQDGDIWFKEHLINYLTGKFSIKDFLDLLKRNQGVYISGTSNQNLFYFGFWEIENLYLMPELLSGWKDTAGLKLNVTRYKELLSVHLKEISDEFLKTFYKSLVRMRVDKNIPVEIMRKKVNEKFNTIQIAITDELPDKVRILIEELLKEDLIHWFPGKEIINVLNQKGFIFDCTEHNFESLSISQQMRLILTK